MEMGQTCKNYRFRKDNSNGMSDGDFLDALREAVANNSNLEADAGRGDVVLFENVASIANVGGELIVSFFNGTAIRVTARRLGDGCAEEGGHGE